jgi:hypothetical protein
LSMSNVFSICSPVNVEQLQNIVQMNR